MSETSQDRFYNLLPDLYRWRDQDQGESLRMFLAIIERELLTVEADMAAQHNNWFIQTCDRWAVTYIADLLGMRYAAGQVEQLPFSLRRLVANTLAYRRRKGTLVILEQVAWDVTNWHVHAVEFQQLLAATQHLQHLRPAKAKTADLHQSALVSDADGPFTTLAHSADVRRAVLLQTPTPTSAAPEQASAKHHGLGKYNRDNIGLFFWRLQSYPVKKSYANMALDTEAHPGCFRFNRNGDIPLFNEPQSFASITQMATAVNMPIKLTHAAFAADLAEFTKLHGCECLFKIDDGFVEELGSNAKPSDRLREEFRRYGKPLHDEARTMVKKVGTEWSIHDTSMYYTIRKGNQLLYVYNGDDSEQTDHLPPNSQYYGPDRGLNILRNGRHIPLWKVASLNLRKWPELSKIANWDPQKEVAIDVERGRMVFLKPPLNCTNSVCTDVVTDYAYGFSAEIGGGPYSRNLQLDEAQGNYFEIQVAIGGVDGESWEGKNLLASFRKDDITQDMAIVDSLGMALACWDAYCTNSKHKRRGFIYMLDNGLYEIAAVSLPAGAELTIIATDGVQPTITAAKKSSAIQIQLREESPATRDDAGVALDRQLCLNGLRVEQMIEIGRPAKSTGNRLNFSIEHCTLMHAGLSLRTPPEANNSWLTVQIDHSIVGPLCLPGATDLLITDSIVDSNGAVDSGHDSSAKAIICSQLSVERSTIFGRVEADQLKRASGVIFDSPISVKSDTDSFVEYSYFGEGSNITRPKDCPPPDPRPVFTSRRYGQPGYAQLSIDCSPEIRRAENGTEIGVFYHLSQPQREHNIGSMLDEYLPYGFEVGVFYVT